MRTIEDRTILAKLMGTLDEAQKRWFVGREAMLLGHGGIKRMCEVSGLSKPTVIKAVKELQNSPTLRPAEGRIRQVGGGRKPLEESDPQLSHLLRRIMDETTAGDPMSLLKWTSKSTYQIRDELQRRGHPVSEDTIQRRLKEMDYTLQANVKRITPSKPTSKPRKEAPRRNGTSNSATSTSWLRSMWIGGSRSFPSMPKNGNASEPLKMRVASGIRKASPAR